MAKGKAGFKPQSPATIEANRLRRKRKALRFEQKCIKKLRNRKVAKGAARVLRRSPRNMPTFRKLQAARKLAQKGTIKADAPQLRRVMATLEAQVEG